MKKCLIVLVTLFFLAPLSLAWEKGKTGLNMRVDPSPRIGMTYHISRNFALRPYIGFSIGTEKSETEYQPLTNLPYVSGERDTETTSVTLGFGFLFYFYSARDISVYTGLNFGYSRVNRDISFSWRDDTLEEDGETYQTNALLGLQCQVANHLSLFGEIGLGYTRGLFNQDNITDTNTKTNKWGLVNTGVGLVFYF
jgi:hypothetical protein